MGGGVGTRAPFFFCCPSYYFFFCSTMADDSQTDPSGTPITPLSVRLTASGATFAIENALSSWKVSELKSAVETAAGAGTAPASGQRLIYKGRVLKDDSDLGSYGARAASRLRERDGE